MPGQNPFLHAISEALLSALELNPNRCEDKTLAALLNVFNLLSYTFLM